MQNNRRDWDVSRKMEVSCSGVELVVMNLLARLEPQGGNTECQIICAISSSGLRSIVKKEEQVIQNEEKKKIKRLP